MKKPVYFFASLIVVGLFLNGCGNKKGGVIKCSGEKPDTSVASPPPSGDSIKPHSDIQSQVWIDASYSMKGYVDTKEGPRFYGMIGALGTLKEISGIALFGTSLGDLDSYDSFNKKLENKKNATYELKMDNYKLPIKKGDKVGSLNVYVDGNLYREIDVTFEEDANKANLITLYGRYLKKVLTGDIVF